VHAGLGWIPGAVVPLERHGAARVPHTGWNTIELVPEAAAGTPLETVRNGEAFYFNHGFHLVPRDASCVAARAEHGQALVAAVARGSVLATQFHPEKSQRAGLELLAAFVDWEPAASGAQAMRTSTP
jgi:glutamine amidotransferase